MKQFLTIALFTVALLAPAVASAAGTLKVTTIDPEGVATVQEYTSDDLLAMDTVELRTDNDFVDQMTTFTGPLLRDLLGAASLTSDDEIQITALNDYKTTIPAQEVIDYDVIIAVLQDGQPMSVRDKGPFWVIYPMSEHPELQDPGFNDRLVWQLSEVELLGK